MLPATPLSIPVHSNQLDAVDEVCSAAIGCTQSDVIGQLLLLVVTGLLAVVVIATVVHIREARSAVTEEQSRTATEQRAFSQFAREVARLEPTGPSVQFGHATGSTVAISAAPSPPDRSIQQVRVAYEETVLGMGHYEEEYNEPLVHHMGQELGEELATAVEQSEHLTPPLQRALVERAREAAQDRERLMSRLDHELEALNAADEELSALSESVEEAGTRPLLDWTFPRLADEWNRLAELDSRLSRLVTNRQESLDRNDRSDVHPAPGSLNGYLYARLDTTYPILSDAARVGNGLKAVRRRVLHALTSTA